jgi:N-acyl homoserine lactone hydrolase
MKLWILQLALHPMTGVPVPAYVIEADDGAIVLVDTGFPAACARHGAPSRFRVTDDDHVLRRLARIGLCPSDVRFVVCSHFDPDHAGNHDLFPDAEFVVQRSHYLVARSGRHSRFECNRRHWGDPRLRYRFVDGDGPLIHGVELIETSGHVPGHQSVLVRLREAGPVLLAIDALATRAQADPATRQAHVFDMDPDAALASTHKLRQLCAREGVRLTIYGHDAEQWRTLRLAPELYL